MNKIYTTFDENCLEIIYNMITVGPSSPVKLFW